MRIAIIITTAMMWAGPVLGSAPSPSAPGEVAQNIGTMQFAEVSEAANSFNAVNFRVGLPRARQVQFVQSGLAILGYDSGPADGIIGAQTRAAMALFAMAHGVDQVDATNLPVMFNAVRQAVSLALAESFGTDPSGNWDIGSQATGGDDGAGCIGQEVRYFANGLMFGDQPFAVPYILGLVDGHLEILPPPDGSEFLQQSFIFVDDMTINHMAAGESEVWVRCNDWREVPPSSG